MAFSQFKSLSAVAQAFTVQTRSEDFVPLYAGTLPSTGFLERLPVILAERLHKASEAARCELLITPILYDAWLQYRSTLKLWSHVPLEYDEQLIGTPDYLIARQSELGAAVIGSPILVAVEAKQDDFDAGWGQCAAEMVAVQKLNNNEALTVFGIVTNGESWEFAKLERKLFTQHQFAYTIADLDKLFGALTFVMEECKKQVEIINS